MNSNIVPYKVPLQKFIYSGAIERKKINRRDDDFRLAVEQATAGAAPAHQGVHGFVSHLSREHQNTLKVNNFNII
jgi:hypothetical protein